jgi:hypothetical protein
MLGSAKKDEVPGNAKEDDAQDVKDENNSPSSLVAILPLMTRSTTQAAEDVSGVSIVHPVIAAKETKPNDAMDPEVRINAINKEVRGLINRRAFSPVHVDAIHSHANIIGTRNIARLKHFDTIYEETKARLTIQECQDAEKNRIVFNAPTVSHAFIRILISFAAIKVNPVWTKESTHAFLQSKDTFSRDLYAEKNRIVSNAPTVSYASIRILISFAAIKVHPVCRERTRSRVIYTQCYLLIYDPSLRLRPEDAEAFVRYKGGWDVLEHRIFRRLEAESRHYSIHAGSMFYD